VPCSMASVHNLSDLDPRVARALVDFHCHLDLYQDHGAVIDECERLGICTLTVTMTPKAWPRNRDLTRETRYVWAAHGLHPQLVAERIHELPLLETHLPETRYVGEVGLDAGSRFYRSFDQQKQVFERILTLCAQHGDKILTVHSVRAVTTILDMIETPYGTDVPDSPANIPWGIRY
jgi:TatD DNase family protein